MQIWTQLESQETLKEPLSLDQGEFSESGAPVSTMDTTIMTPEQEAAFLTQNRQGEVYAVHITFFVLMLLAVYARYTSARMAQKPLSWDDWFAFAAAVGSGRRFPMPHLLTRSQ